jgi:hypothetical protein
LKKAVLKKKNEVVLLPDTTDKSVVENLTYEIKLVDSSGPA